MSFEKQEITHTVPKLFVYPSLRKYIHFICIEVSIIKVWNIYVYIEYSFPQV